MTNLPGKVTNLPLSVRVDHQDKELKSVVNFEGRQCNLAVRIRYDDSCKNGHNTLRITGNFFDVPEKDYVLGGAIHKEIAEYHPKLKHIIRWHNMNSNGPPAYVENTEYFVKSKRYDLARRAAFWPDATDEELMSDNLEELLLARLPKLLEEFKLDVESLGFLF